MKKSLGQAPLFKVLLPFLAGILLAILFLPQTQYLLFAILFIAGGVSLVIIIKTGLNKHFSFSVINGIALFLILAGVSILDVFLHSAELRPDFFSKRLKYHDSVLVKITEPLQEKDNIMKGKAAIVAVGHSANLNKTSGNLLVYFEKDSGAAYPGYGDLVWIANTISPLEPPKNPGEFDYRQYMAYQDIYHSSGAYISVGTID
jgi:competence protein ComEC